jgi:hypothetical protein
MVFISIIDPIVTDARRTNIRRTAVVVHQELAQWSGLAFKPAFYPYEFMVIGAWHVCCSSNGMPNQLSQVHQRTRSPRAFSASLAVLPT